jgi:Fuc2NAc and GlcNAc transferase
MIVPLLLPIAAFLAVFWLTGCVRRYALKRHLLDVPNVRSSHVVATPRGGGVAIALATLAALLVLVSVGSLLWPHASGVIAGGLVVATIGFVDDHRDTPRLWRLLTQAVSAALALWGLSGLPPVQILAATVDLGWVGHALAAAYLVWVINLTNFMDGIDGLAATESIIVSLSGVLLYWVTGPAQSHWTAPLMLASATLGFLVWNWPPATIFMGDAGSGFLGLMLAVFSLDAGWTAPELFWSWVILLGVFIVDATVTLVRRTMRGERFYEAHRSHAYQHAAQRWGAHKPVTLAVAAINMLWLLPLALLVARHALDGMIGVVVAYTPLVAAALWLRAGAPGPFRAGAPSARV